MLSISGSSKQLNLRSLDSPIHLNQKLLILHAFQIVTLLFSLLNVMSESSPILGFASVCVSSCARVRSPQSFAFVAINFLISKFYPSSQTANCFRLMYRVK
jgi:hypothetical protein